MIPARSRACRLAAWLRSATRELFDTRLNVDDKPMDQAALIEAAEDNARRNGVDNVEFDVADLTQDVSARPWFRAGFDSVLIDPPRSGAFEVLPMVAACGARRLVYVSCNPGTLARDAAELVSRHGFRLVGAGIADMFAHTAHVESIALFERP